MPCIIFYNLPLSVTHIRLSSTTQCMITSYWLQGYFIWPYRLTQNNIMMNAASGFCERVWWECESAIWLLCMWFDWNDSLIRKSSTITVSDATLWRTVVLNTFCSHRCNTVYQQVTFGNSIAQWNNHHKWCQSKPLIEQKTPYIWYYLIKRIWID